MCRVHCDTRLLQGLRFCAENLSQAENWKQISSSLVVSSMMAYRGGLMRHFFWANVNKCATLDGGAVVCLRFRVFLGLTPFSWASSYWHFRGRRRHYAFQKRRQHVTGQSRVTSYNRHIFTFFTTAEHTVFPSSGNWSVETRSFCFPIFMDLLSAW
jgi:hypothetical protein